MFNRIVDSIVGFPRFGGVQRAYNWDLVLPDIYGFLVSGVLVSKYCQSIQFHQYDVVDVIELKRGIFVRRFPASLKLDYIRTTFVVPTPDIVSTYFIKWRSMMYDRYGRCPPSDMYKRTMHVILYDRSGIPSNLIKLTGVFPMVVPAFDLDYTREAPLVYHIDFCVDDVDMGISSVLNNILG